MKKILFIIALFISTLTTGQGIIRLNQIEPIQGTVIKSTGETSGKVLTTNGTNGSLWQIPATWQTPLNGTGLVRMAGTTASFDNTNYTSQDATMLGVTGNKSFDSATDTPEEWSALPVGYSRMIGSVIGTSGGAPIANYGYFTKVGNRNSGGGWAGLWAGYVAGQSYIGRSATSETFASWDLLYSSGNSNSTSFAWNSNSNNSLQYNLNGTDINTAGTLTNVAYKGSLTTNYLPKYGVNQLENSQIFDNGTKVGIGTISPTGILHTKAVAYADVSISERGGQTGNSMFNAFRVLSTKTTDMTDGFGTGVSFTIQDNAGVINPIATIGAVRDGADNSGSLVLRTISGGTDTEHIRIKPNGNVGIGTTTPGEKFEVAGKTKTTTFQMTTGANNGYVLISDASGNGTWTIPTTGITDHSLLSNLVYASSGHTGFAGTGVANDFTAKQTVTASVNANYAAEIINPNALGNGLLVQTSAIGTQPILTAQSLTSDLFRVNADGSIKLNSLPTGAESYMVGYNPTTKYISYQEYTAPLTYTASAGVNLTGDNFSLDANSLSLMSGGSVVDADYMVVYDASMGADYKVLMSGLKTYIGTSGMADPMTTRGDIMYRNSSNVTARLPIGASSRVLTSNGTDVTWAAIPAVPDGKITNVTFTSPNLTFTGSSGAFNGSVNLSALTSNQWTSGSGYIYLTNTTDHVNIGDNVNPSSQLTVSGVIETFAGIHTPFLNLSNSIVITANVATPTVISNNAVIVKNTDNRLWYASNTGNFDLTNVVEPFRSISATTTLSANDKIVFATTGGITITYPTVPAGKVYTIRNTTSSSITVPTYTILGPASSSSVAAYGCITVCFSGAGWYQID